MRIRRSEERGHADHGWLDTYHTFSFAGYYDPAHMGFRALRVINEDRVAPHTGFGAHGHMDMEILTYVLSGAVEHKDSEGNEGVIRAGELQRMSAGTGIRHSEMNRGDEPLHLLQIWIEPARTGTPPGYEQKAFDEAELREGLRVVAAPANVADAEGADGALRIGQDAEVRIGLLEPGVKRSFELRAGRGAWVHSIDGELLVDGERLAAGDAAAFEADATKSRTIELEGVGEASRALVFDLP